MASDKIPRNPRRGQFPCAEELHTALIYDPATGLFTWRHRPDLPAKWNARMAGKPAGRVKAHGYVVFAVNNLKLYAHRVAWCMAIGDWPAAEIDHINRIKSDNRIANLRAATRGQNLANTPDRGPVSGVKGVQRNRDKWQALITIGGKRRCLGTFETVEEAATARRDAHKAAFREFSHEAQTPAAPSLDSLGKD